MSKVKIESHADVAILRLSNGVTNAISPELVDDLADALDQAKEEFKGLILAGGSKFFSIGFDFFSIFECINFRSYNNIGDCGIINELLC